MNDMIARKQAHSDTYRLLSACFCLPDKQAFLEENVFVELAHALEQACPQAIPYADEMNLAVKGADEEELHKEYARLFVGPHQLLAPPYGSVYLEKGRSVMGKSTLELLAFLNEEGLWIDDEFHELPDHISAELEFMYYLITQELVSYREGRSDDSQHYVLKQSRFLVDYLYPWVDPFCRNILDNTSHIYFQSLAHCLRTFIQESEASLDETGISDHIADGRTIRSDR